MNNVPNTRLRILSEIDPAIIQQGNIVEVIVKYNGDIIGVGNALGAQTEILNSDYAIMTIQMEQIPLLYDFDEVEYIELPKILKFVLSESLGRSCIPPVHNQARFQLKGAGTIVGIIDSGIDYTHPDFRNEDGTSRILFIWDQTISGTPPEGFKSGAEYSNEQINIALNNADPFSIVPTRDEVGHGTAVSGIAAGNGRSSGGRETGVAPKSSIIVVKLGRKTNEYFARSTEIMRGIKYLSDKAQKLRMPVSMNISFGTNDGSHDGKSLFETYIDSMAERWKTVISVASGNEASAGHHFASTVQQDKTESVSFLISGSVQRVYMTLWKNFVDTFTYELIAPGGRSTGTMRPEQITHFTVLDNVAVTVLFGQPTHYSEAQELYFIFRSNNATLPQGLWTLKVTGEQVVDGRFDIWLPTVEDVTNQTSFSIPSIETTLTLPSTSQNVITVGGYNAAVGDAAVFSGRGFTRSNVYVKPDLLAPAVGVLTTRAGGGYDSFTGTSMAAPFVTGSAALMMEWGIVRENDPFLYGQRVKAFLQKGARRDLSIQYPNPIWGYGALCLERTMDYLVEYVRVVR